MRRLLRMARRTPLFTTKYPRRARPSERLKRALYAILPEISLQGKILCIYITLLALMMAGEKREINYKMEIAFLCQAFGIRVSPGLCAVKVPRALRQV